MQASNLYNKPFQYYFITFVMSWSFLFFGAYFSYQENMKMYEWILIIFGLFSPFFVALLMMYGTKNKPLINDFWMRLNFREIKFSYLPVLFLLMPLLILLATTLSLLSGQAIEQFTISKEFSAITDKNLASLIILFIAPFVAPIGEELGWRGYGVDSIRSQFSLLTTNLLFGFIWGIWHLPLFFIKNFYENQLWNTGIFYVINFFISHIAYGFLINWVYYKNNRNIIACIILHFMINLSSTFFRTEELTKCIMTFLLLIFLFILFIRNKHENRLASCFETTF